MVEVEQSYVNKAYDLFANHYHKGETGRGFEFWAWLGFSLGNYQDSEELFKQHHDRKNSWLMIPALAEKVKMYGGPYGEVFFKARVEQDAKK